MSNYNCSLSAINPQGTPSPVSKWLLAQLKEMNDRTYVANPFRSVGEFAEHFDLALNRKSYWRLTDFKLGHINGLPNSHGRIVATDGIMCYVYRGTDSLYLGHVSAWVNDPEEYRIGKGSSSSSCKSTTTKKKLIDWSDI